MEEHCAIWHKHHCVNVAKTKKQVVQSDALTSHVLGFSKGGHSKMAPFFSELEDVCYEAGAVMAAAIASL